MRFAWTAGDALELRILGRQLALVQAGNNETFNSVHKSVWVGVSRRQEGDEGKPFQNLRR